MNIHYLLKKRQIQLDGNVSKNTPVFTRLGLSLLCLWIGVVPMDGLAHERCISGNIDLIESPSSAGSTLLISKRAYNNRGAASLLYSDLTSANGILSKNSSQTAINGIIQDANGKVLAGATIRVKGTRVTAASGSDGRFNIEAAADATLVITSVGFKPTEVSVNSRKNIVVKLEILTAQIEEVVTTGYQRIKKESLTGSVTKVKAEDIKVASMGTLDKMLQGQVAGVTVETASATFGTAPKIRIRGTSSLSGVNEPLWVLDGVPLESPLNIAPSELYSGGARNLLSSALSGVNPDDIEDITVLRDATATAMYGTRAVNGVIVINTKRGRRNTPLMIGYSGNTTLSMRPSITQFDVLNSLDQTNLNQEIFDIYQSQLMSFSAETSGAYSKLNYLRNIKAVNDQQYRERIRDLKVVNTDWFDHLYKNSITHQHSLNTIFGGERASVRASVSYFNDQGKTVGEKVNRYTVNLNANYQVAKWMDADFMIKYSNRSQHNPGTLVNPFKYATQASRNMSPYTAAGDYEYYKRGYTDFNILKEIDNNYIDLDNKDFTAQVELNFKINKQLNLKALLSTRSVNNQMDEIATEYSNYANQFRQLGIIPGQSDGFFLTILDRNNRLYKDPSKPLYVPAVSVLPTGGIMDRETSASNFYTGRFQFEYNPITDLNGHSLRTLGGFEFGSNEQEGNFSRNYGYISANKTMSPNDLALRRLILGSNLPTDELRMYEERNLLAGSFYYPTIYQRRTVGYYGNLSYDYNKKYVLDLTARVDAANITGARYTPTYGVGLAWNLSNEGFMEFLNDSKILTNVKIRGTYGLRGNDGARGPALVAYNTNVTRVYPEYNATGVMIQEPENKGLKFEMEHTLDFGANFTLFDKADVTVDWYRRNNFDLLDKRDLALSTGYQTKVFNWANMQNKGLELQVHLREIELAKNWHLGLMVNAAYTKNIMLSDKRGGADDIYKMASSIGYPLPGKERYALYSFRFAGLNADGLPEYFDANNKKVAGFVSTLTDPSILEYQGSRDPKYSGGFTPTVRFKDLVLSAAFIFNAGHVVRLGDFYRNNEISTLFRDDLNAPGDYAYRWTTPGDEVFTNIPRLLTDLDIDNYNTVNGLFNNSIFGAYNASNIRTANASYLRFRNINLQYNFREYARRLGIKGLTASIEASNLAIWSSGKLNGQDPEILLNGINIPPVKSFTFSLNLTF